MSKIIETTEYTKKVIRDAFWLLYVESGITNISVTDIINKAGYNRSTFYQYFNNKYAVLEAVENEIIQHFVSALTEIYTHDMTRENSLEILADLYSSRSEYLSVLLSSNGDPAFMSKFKNTLYPLWVKIVGISNPNEYSRLIFEYSVSGMFYTITQWHNSGKVISIKELASLMRQIAFNGAITEIAKLNA